MMRDELRLTLENDYARDVHHFLFENINSFVDCKIEAAMKAQRRRDRYAQAITRPNRPRGRRYLCSP